MGTVRLDTLAPGSLFRILPSLPVMQVLHSSPHLFQADEVTIIVCRPSNHQKLNTLNGWQDVYPVKSQANPPAK